MKFQSFTQVKYKGSKKVLNFLTNPDFEITISFFTQEVLFSRETNVATLIQNILNSLSLSLGISIIGVFDFVFRLVRLTFNLIWELLLYFRVRLQSLLV